MPSPSALDYHCFLPLHLSFFFIFFFYILPLYPCYICSCIPLFSALDLFTSSHSMPCLFASFLCFLYALDFSLFSLSIPFPSLIPLFFLLPSLTSLTPSFFSATFILLILLPFPSFGHCSLITRLYYRATIYHIFCSSKIQHPKIKEQRHYERFAAKYQLVTPQGFLSLAWIPAMLFICGSYILLFSVLITLHLEFFFCPSLQSSLSLLVFLSILTSQPPFSPPLGIFFLPPPFFSVTSLCVFLYPCPWNDFLRTYPGTFTSFPIASCLPDVCVATKIEDVMSGA